MSRSLSFLRTITYTLNDLLSDPMKLSDLIEDTIINIAFHSSARDVIALSQVTFPSQAGRVLVF